MPKQKVEQVEERINLHMSSLFVIILKVEFCYLKKNQLAGVTCIGSSSTPFMKD